MEAVESEPERLVCAIGGRQPEYGHRRSTGCASRRPGFRPWRQVNDDTSRRRAERELLMLAPSTSSGSVPDCGDHFLPNGNTEGQDLIDARWAGVLVDHLVGRGH